jgi:hypothetical protein
MVVTWSEHWEWLFSAAARARLGEVVHWVRGLKHKCGVLTGELNLKASDEDDMVR